MVVGVNRYAGGEEEPVTIMQLDPAIADAQAKALVEIRATRDADAVQAVLADLRDAARGRDNLLPPCARPSATWPPSARSATPSAPSSAPTAPRHLLSRPGTGSRPAASKLSRFAEVGPHFARVT